MTARGNPTLQYHLAWEQAMRLNQNVTVRCDFCEWHTTGCLYHTSKAHQHHRSEHPQAVTVTRRRRNGRSPMMTASKGLDENIANARKQGASSWDGATE